MCHFWSTTQCFHLEVMCFFVDVVMWSSLYVTTPFRFYVVQLILWTWETIMAHKTLHGMNNSRSYKTTIVQHKKCQRRDNLLYGIQNLWFDWSWICTTCQEASRTLGSKVLSVKLGALGDETTLFPFISWTKLVMLKSSSRHLHKVHLKIV